MSDDHGDAEDARDHGESDDSRHDDSHHDDPRRDDSHREPHREEFHHDPIAHAEARAGMTVGELADAYGDAGIGAADVHEAVDIYAEMIGREDVTNFFGLAGAMVPTGMRRIVADLIRDGHVDALVTTGANLTHDAIEAIGGKHHHGRASPSSSHSQGSREHGTEEPGADRSLRDHDEQLRDEQVDRIYNVYLPQEHFALFEDHLRSEVFPAVEGDGDGEDGDGKGGDEDDGVVSIQRFTEELGRANSEVNEREGIEEGAGVAAAAYENDVPIYCPAIQDSVLGLQAWMYSQTADFSLDALADMTAITDQAFHAEKAGAMVVGGGVPKNYTLQTMLVAPDAYDYAVQLTMDTPQTGGLSGATLDEARSWGKLEKAARNASVYADATITLPLVVAAARERIEE